MQGQVFSEANCAGVINNLVSNLINQHQSLESDFANQRVEIFKASSALNGVSHFLLPFDVDVYLGQLTNSVPVDACTSCFDTKRFRSPVRLSIY